MEFRRQNKFGPKFLIVLVFFSFIEFNINQAFAMFSSSDCIVANFSKQIFLPAKYLGIFKREISLAKDRCLLSLKFKSSFWFSKWEVDLCRDPIHLRYENFLGPELFRKNTSCLKGQSDQFCDSAAKLKEVIQNELLLFAEGERDQLSTSHGTSYCLNLLFASYLEKDFSFSMESTHEYDIFKQEKVPETATMPWNANAKSGDDDAKNPQHPKLEF